MNQARTGQSAVLAVALIAAIMLAVASTGINNAQAQSQRPAAPTGFSVEAGDRGELDVSWDAHADGASDYRLAWAPADGRFRNWQNENWNAFPTGTSHTITGLNDDTEYKVKLRARFDDAKSSQWTQVANATTIAAPQPPAQVRNPQAAQQPDQTPVSITWSAADGADAYQLIRQHSPEQPGDPTTWDLGDVTSYSDATVDYNTRYRYRVRGKNDAGYGTWSSWARITTAREPGTPAKPGNLSLSEETAGEVVITWTAPDGDEDVEGYRVYRNKLSSGTQITLAQPGADATSHTDATVEAETNYEYWAVAWNDTGDSPDSSHEIITTKVQTTGVPEAPGRPSVSEQARGEMVITWTAPSNGPDPTQYRVYRRDSWLGDYNSLATVDASTNSYTDDTIGEEKWYTYRVTALNDEGEGTASRNRTVKTRVQTAGVPNVPEDLELSEDTNGEVTVSWNAPDDGPTPTKYRVTRETLGESDSEISWETTGTSLTDATVAGETWYGYRVRSINDAGDGDETSTDYIETENQTEGAPDAPDDANADQ